MPIIEYRSAGDEIGEAVLSGVNSYMAFSEMHRRRAQDELDAKIANKSLQWEQEDRDLLQRQRAAEGELASRMVSGTGTPSEIALRKGEEIAAAGMRGFMTGGLVGSLQGIATETPKAMERSEQRTKRLDELMRDLSPQARQLARQDFAKQGAIDVARAAQTDVSKHLRAVIRRGKMPGHEEVLASLLENVDSFDPETGVGMAPWEAEREFRRIYGEYIADQADMKATQASVQSLSNMAAGLGVGADPAVLAAIEGRQSGGMTHVEAFKAVLAQTKEGRSVLGDLELKERAHNLALESFGDMEPDDFKALRERTAQYKAWLEGGGQGQGPSFGGGVPRGAGGEGKGREREEAKAPPPENKAPARPAADLMREAAEVGIPMADAIRLGREGELEDAIKARKANAAPKLSDTLKAGAAAREEFGG